MPTIAEDILQAVRRWLKAAAASSPLTDDQVIPANDDGPRPDLPYIAVNVTAPGIVYGVDEQIRDLDGSGDPQVWMRGIRTATMSVHGYGVEAGDWLADAVLNFDLPSIAAQLDTDGIAVRPIGGVDDVTDLLDTGFEPRYLLEVAVDYALERDDMAESQTPLSQVEVTAAFEGQPSDLVETWTIPAP